MTDVGVRGSEKQRVAFLLLDGVELETIEHFRAEGIMPNVDRLLSNGLFRSVDSRDDYSAESTPTEMITGQTAEEIRYWSLMRFNPETYRCTNFGAYRGPAFYDRPDLRSIVFDVPHMRIDPSTPGVQVAAWGAHSAQFPRSSNPPELIVELEAEFGTMHTPEFEDIQASHNVEWARGLTDHMIDSLQKRPKIVSWLMDKEPDWDLLFIGSTETHVHEHGFHHTIDATHELHDHPTAPAALEMMRDLFIAVDKMVGEVEALIPDDAVFVIGTMHGAKASAVDSSSVLANELVYRDQTGKQMLDLPLHLHKSIELEPWMRARTYLQRHKVSAGKADEPGLKNALTNYMRWASHRYTPLRVEQWLEHTSRKLAGQQDWWKISKNAPLTEPNDISGPIQTADVLTEPSNWYSHAWPEMRFFTIPSFSTLHVRINLEGREKFGTVKLEDYEAACQEVEDLLGGMTDAVTGQPLCEKFARVRVDDPFASDGPSCDITVKLNAATTIDHPEYGRLGTVPFGRVAEHSERGWLLVATPGVVSTAKESVRPADLGATLIELIGLGPTERCSGRPAFEASDSLVAS